MKRLTTAEARKQKKSHFPERQDPDYRNLLRAPEADQADKWTWVWQKGAPGELLFIEDGLRQPR